jgi:hypothetical protein
MKVEEREVFRFMVFFYCIGIVTFFIVALLSVWFRKKYPQKMWPEWMLICLFALSFLTVLYSIFVVGGWEGMGLGLIAIFVFFGTVAGYAAERVLRLMKICRK